MILNRHLLPRLLESRKANDVEMLHRDHRRGARAIHGRVRRFQEHVLFHHELGQTIILARHGFAMLQRPDQLDHVPVVLVQACSLEDLVPAAVGHFGGVAEEPVDVGTRASHARPQEEQHVARRFDHVRLLCPRDRRFGQEDGMPEACVGAVDEEEVVAGFVWGPLGRRCDIDCPRLVSSFLVFSSFSI